MTEQFTICTFPSTKLVPALKNEKEKKAHEARY
jgi:hypothetical protein